MRFPYLFSPLTVGKLELANRIVMAPLGTGFARNGFATEEHKAFYLTRAEGRVGLIIVGGVLIRPPVRLTPIWDRHPCLYDDKFVPDWKEITSAVHQFGTKIGVQLTDFGRQTTGKVYGERPVSSSAIKCPVCREVPRELTVGEIKKIVLLFAEAARRACDAGFDVIEIHGAHGYLGTNFLSPYMNKRSDKYGGSAEGRARFLVEIIQETRKRVAESIAVGMRYNGADNIEGGATIEDAKDVTPFFIGAGADFLSISAGVYGGYPLISPGIEPPGCYVHLAETIKKMVDVPVITAGKIKTPEFAEEIIRTERADLVALGRPLIADGHWALKAASRETDRIRKCIYCNQSCLETLNELNLQGALGSLRCVVNPEVGREREFKLIPAMRRKEVLVVGGGPAGLEAARVAALRGHRVTLYDRDSGLGGQLLLASTLPTKRDFKGIIEYFTSEARKLGVELRLGTEVTKEMIRTIKPDVVVIATGAISLIPEIFGITSGNVATAHDVLARKVAIGNSVVIIGGGSTGLETADFLATIGKRVIVLETLNRLAGDAGRIEKFVLRRRLAEKGVESLVACHVKEIGKRYVKITIEGEERIFSDVDNVVIAVGCIAVNYLAGDIESSIQEVYVIGDAVRPRKAIDAIYEGADIGRVI